MIKIGIIDDDENDINILKKNLKKYFSAQRIEYSIKALDVKDDVFENIEKIDLLFLDIDMPNTNGIVLAEQIRKKLINTSIVFITNFFQYATEGYHVNALDYILKPIDYQSFSLKMKRIIGLLNTNKNEDAKLAVKTKEGLIFILINDIVAVEVKGHYLTYIMSDSRRYISRGQLKQIKEDLGDNFELCNSYYLIHLKYVCEVNNENVVTKYGEFAISRAKRTRFLDHLSCYIGGIHK